MTTAASLWVVAGIGLAVGSNCYIPALFTTALAIFALLLLPLFERNIKRDIYKNTEVVRFRLRTRFYSYYGNTEKGTLWNCSNTVLKRKSRQNEVILNINVRFKDEASVTKVSDEVARVS